MENFQTQYTPEEHGLIITDVRFRPNSSHLATSSFDRTIKLWNAADVSYVCLSIIGIVDICYYPSYSNVTIILLQLHYCTCTLLRYRVFPFSIHGCKSSYTCPYCHHVSKCCKAQL